MSRCPYLEYQGGGLFDSTDEDYRCRISGQTMDLYSEKVKYTCNRDYGDAYENCPYYKNH